MKKIIGIIGEIGAGKDTFSEYFKRRVKNVFIFRFSDVLIEILRLFFDSIKREDLQWLGKSIKERFGQGILAEALIRKTKSIKKGIIILNGVRSKEEAEIIKKNKGKLVYITADRKLRWQRIKKRKEKADDNVSYKKFIKIEKASTELEIPQIGQRADFKIENNSSKSDFYRKIDELINKIL